MIKLNGKPIEITRFPDNTFKFDLDEIKNENKITWMFESMEELFTIIGLADKLKHTDMSLYMPYMPNARMDKTYHDGEGLMLKYLVETLDNLKFNSITILDPHSDIYKKWIKNTMWISDEKLVKDLITFTTNTIMASEQSTDVTMVYPDKGARDRYSSLLNVEDNLYGIKERCQKTGKILNFDIVGDIPNGPILIVDDISSKGGTFYFTAKKLREKGFTSNIYLHITHAESAIQDGELLKENSEIKRIFTTNSILTHDIPKTTIYEL